MPDYLVIIPFKKAEKESIIIDPTKEKDEEIPCDGEVVAVGSNIKHVQIGDKIFFNRFAPDVTEIEKQKYFLIQEKDVYGVYELPQS